MFQENPVFLAFPIRQGSRDFLGRQETRERRPVDPESRLGAEQSFPVKSHVLPSKRTPSNVKLKLVLLLTPGAGLTSPVDLGGFGHTGQHSPSGVYISVGLNS